MTNSDNETRIVLVGGTLYAIETGPGNEDRYEVRSGFGGDYLVDTHNPAIKTFDSLVSFVIITIKILACLFFLSIVFCGC
jgi:hypothetical protein